MLPVPDAGTFPLGENHAKSPMLSWLSLGPAAPRRNSGKPNLIIYLNPFLDFYVGCFDVSPTNINLLRRARWLKEDLLN